MAQQFVETQPIALYVPLAPGATSAIVTPYPLDIQTNKKLVFADFGTTPTVTVDPGVSGFEEIISFTGITDNGNNTATLTGLTRNLIGQSPYTSAGTGKNHGSNAVVVFSNNPQMYARLASLENANSFTALQKFTAGAVIVKRVQSVGNVASLTPNCDNYDCVDIAAIAQAFTIVNPAGTPADFQTLIIRILDNGAGEAITWGNTYVAMGNPLPVVTIANKYLIMGFQYNATLSKWGLVAVVNQA